MTEYLRPIFIAILVPLCFLPGKMFAQLTFTDATEEAGINHSFQVFQGIFGGGAAVIDFNQDGWEDVFLSGGAGPNQLLQNMGDGSFQNVSTQAGLNSLDGYVTQGAAVADVNRDGWPDLYVTTITFVFGNTFGEAPNILLINNKDGTFSDQSLSFGLVEGSFSTGASFGDVNRDGYPDLYVCNYFSNFEGSLDEFEGPLVNGNTSPAADLLYINVDGERFVESSQLYGIERAGLTFQALWTDFDNDNDLDILVANDFGDRETPNLVYRNEFPRAAFTEIGEAMDFDYGINGMGLAAADVNMDGWLDYLVTNIQISPFFINEGPDKPFREKSYNRGIGFSTIGTNDGTRVVPVSWGANFFDIDHDMDSDLYISNGCLNPSLLPNPNLFLENRGGLYREFGFETQTNDHSIGRGSVVFDYDKDGDMDLLVINQTPYQEENPEDFFRPSRLYKNENNSNYHWLKIKLEGIKSETSGIGSRIEAHLGGGEILLREIYGGSSHESQNSTIVHLGLGPYDKVDSLVIKWSASGKQVLQNIQADRLIEIAEDSEELSFQTPGFEIYPVPFTDQLWIDVPSKDIGKTLLLRLFDIQGQEIYRRLIPSTKALGNQVDIRHHLAAGIYVVKLEGEGFNYKTKLLRTN
ncbi:MAG: FG-GAP-like repeat-containing protein [Bacteroidia bacterium]|nr:FG-GAP-like repeat-containing protein [Bacteroidia bacterium]